MACPAVKLCPALIVVGGPMATLKELLVADDRPLLAALIVYDPGVENVRFENVTLPPEAFTVVVPPTPEGVDVIDTEAVEPVIRLL